MIHEFTLVLDRERTDADLEAWPIPRGRSCSRPHIMV